MRLTVTGRAGVPIRHVAAVALTVTARARRAGELTAYGDGAAAPTTTNLSYWPEHFVSNLMIVPVGTNGRVQTQNQSRGSGDIAGYFLAGSSAGGGAYQPAMSKPLLTAHSGPGRTLNLRVVGGRGLPPADSSAVAPSVTAAHASRAGQLTLHTDGRNGPVAAVVNFEVSQATTAWLLCPSDTMAA